MSYIEGLLLLLVVGVCSVLLADYMNRDVRKIEKIAKIHVRNRFLERMPNELEFDKFNIFGKNISNTIKILSEFARIIGFEEIKLFRLEDKLQNTMRVELKELKDVSLNRYKKSWEKAGLGCYVEVFAYDLIGVLNATLGEVEFKKLTEDLSCSSKSEEEIIDVLFSLELGELLSITSKQIGSTGSDTIENG